jgi:hypothetical protein
VEVADAPAVVDESSMSREYARIGYRTRCAIPNGRTYDTDAANSAGLRVFRELTTGNGD